MEAIGFSETFAFQKILILGLIISYRDPQPMGI
jgi:hypothetical protein